MNHASNDARHFIDQLIQADLDSGRVNAVVTRFPPEPNGYLHIGHAKAICINFGMAQKYGGQCNLRFDDTNPAKEDQEYVEAIQENIRWLGFEWAGDIRFTSDYFEQLHAWAVYLIEQGLAYVCNLNQEEAREYRGDFNRPGKNSPYRDRSVEENLALFAKMRAGEFEEGTCSLRAKIDMAAPNMNMRDPILYRIIKASHHQTGDAWCIYPSYDYAHGQSDAIEGVSHSLCSLEFEDHRPLYDWFIEHLPVPARPVQTEFSRLNLNYTVTSKRKLLQLVNEKHVSGWDDPRMPTLAGLRRRGYTPKSIREFCHAAGVSRSVGVTDLSMLEHAIRDDLDKNAPRAMCVLNPLKVVITNYPEDKTEALEVSNHPQRDDLGTRVLPFSKTLYIDADDFREEANKKYKRLVLGKKVRLRGAYVILATDVVKDADGNIVEVHCEYDADTLGKNPEDGVKPKGVIHWVDAANNTPCEVRLYDRLFNDPSPDSGDKNFLDHINPESLVRLHGCLAEASLSQLPSDSEQRFQFEREGYFCLDKDSTADAVVFNRTIGLKDTFSEPSN